MVLPLRAYLICYVMLWAFDVLSLPVHAAQYGYVDLYRAIEACSGRRELIGILSYEVAVLVECMDILRARVRPFHGEIMVTKCVSHPTHKARAFKSYQASNQTYDVNSPAYLHEGVGEVEVSFFHDVPAAQALIVGAPDLDGSHQFPALLSVEVAANRSFRKSVKGQLCKSSDMIYVGLDRQGPNTLNCFGASCKALVHPEEHERARWLRTHVLGSTWGRLTSANHHNTVRYGTVALHRRRCGNCQCG